MFSKNITASAFLTRLSGQKRLKKSSIHQRNQRGVTLIELMVGITIGLLTVAVAMGALMVSRGVSGTVSDASIIQQQAAYAMRVIGLQLRQAGSLRLNLDPGTAAAESGYLIPAAFETDYTDPADSTASFSIKEHTLKGKKAPAEGEYALSVGYRNYTEPVFTSASAESLQRNCLGNQGNSALILSEFVLYAPTSDPTRRELRCNGNGNVQPIVSNVANFQVRYLLQDNTTTPGISTIKSVDASGVSNWAQVQAVEVCLVLYGNEAMDIPGPTSDNPKQGTYVDCDGSAISMNALTGVRNKRMHIAFRNTYQLRSQGLIGSVL